MTKLEINTAASEITTISITLQSAYAGKVRTVTNPMIWVHGWVINNVPDYLSEYTTPIDTKEDALEIMRLFFNDGRTKEDINRSVKEVIDESKPLFMHYFRLL